jgi:hypothetical protein
MKLSFLGQSYEMALPTIEVTETAESLTFLGRTYAQKQAQGHHRQQPIAEMTYRGIRYSR